MDLRRPIPTKIFFWSKFCLRKKWKKHRLKFWMTNIVHQYFWCCILCVKPFFRARIVLYTGTDKVRYTGTWIHDSTALVLQAEWIRVGRIDGLHLKSTKVSTHSALTHTHTHTHTHKLTQVFLAQLTQVSKKLRFISY